MLPSFNYVRVRSVKEASEQLSKGNARPLAGGTDLLGCLRDAVFQVDTVVSLSALEELRGIREGGGAVRIGALTPLADVASSELVWRRFATLSQAASEVASPQLRNQGTLGGNLCQKPRCWYYRGEFNCLRKGGDICFAVAGDSRYHCIFGGDPCYFVHPSDTAPALIALEAVVEIAGPSGTRAAPVESLFVSPAQNPRAEVALEKGEIITEIRLPSPSGTLLSSYRKVRARGSWDFALSGLAVAAQMSGNKVLKCRLVLSGVAPVPWRLTRVEAALTGQELTPALVAKAAEAAVQDAQPLDHNAYKVAMTQGLVEQQLAALVAKSG
jgi:xanthine dehydrogenase YagS FAD-binding subunit